MWPFELLVLPKKPTQRMSDLSPEQQQCIISTPFFFRKTLIFPLNARIFTVFDTYPKC